MQLEREQPDDPGEGADHAEHGLVVRPGGQCRTERAQLGAQRASLERPARGALRAVGDEVAAPVAAVKTACTTRPAGSMVVAGAT